MLKKIDLDDISVEFKEISSKCIYCLFHRQYNIIVDNNQAEIDDCIIAYSDNINEIIEYRNSLVINNKYLTVQLYIRKIPNVFYY